MGKAILAFAVTMLLGFGGILLGNASDIPIPELGAVRYKSLVYEVTKIHQPAPETDGVKPYIDGFEVKILGRTIYRETNE